MQTKILTTFQKRRQSSRWCPVFVQFYLLKLFPKINSIGPSLIAVYNLTIEDCWITRVIGRHYFSIRRVGFNLSTLNGAWNYNYLITLAVQLKFEGRNHRSKFMLTG